MISEVTFCHLHSSFWRVVAPTTDLFIRRLNRDLYKREFPPMSTSIAPERRGFVNEVAFALFCSSVRAGKRWPLSEPPISEVRELSVSFHTSLGRAEARDDSHTEDSATEEEIADICEQHQRMISIFTQDVDTDHIVARPAFSGCGIVDSCVGDVLISTTLYEVKAGDRSFRSIDIRQLLTYTALNHVSRQHKINSVGLFNPRVGICATIDLNKLCFEVSGKDAVSLLTEIVFALSSGEISR